jgi:hypothetical protein
MGSKKHARHSRQLSMPLLLLAFLALPTRESSAAVTVYTGRAAFLTDAAGLGAQILDFESETQEGSQSSRTPVMLSERDRMWATGYEKPA